MEKFQYLSLDHRAMEISQDQWVRYDRQVRLWGEEGQASIGATSVCLLGSDALGTEILKSLVLAGINSFLIVDDAIVEQTDLGQSFFLELNDIGRKRAEATLEKIKELNPSVSGVCSVLSPSEYIKSNAEQLSGFSVVVTSNQSPDVETATSELLYDVAVPFICARTYGLLGTIKVSVKMHYIANTHEENPRPDFRLDRPFPELLEMVNESKWDEMSKEQRRLTPYILLMFSALQKYREQKNDPNCLPYGYENRTAYREILKTMQGGWRDFVNFQEAFNAITRAFYPCSEIESNVRKVFDDPQTQESRVPFWIMAYALRDFYEKNDALPLRGTIPDMTSDSARYSRLVSIYHDKAVAEANEVLRTVREEETRRGTGELISDEMCYRFCKNAHNIDCQRGVGALNYEEEMGRLMAKMLAADLDEQGNRVPRDEEMGDGAGGDEREMTCEIWLLLLRAVDRFAAEKGRYPGTNGVPCQIDAFDLKQRVEAIVGEAAGENADLVLKKIPGKAVEEMCRFGAGQLHVVTALVGGITAQEIIKLATNQYVPISNTFIFDGHTQQSTTLEI